MGSSCVPDRGGRGRGVVLRKRWIDIAVLNTHDPEVRVVVSGGKNGAISRGGPDVIAFGTRIRRVDKGLAAKDDTIGVHKISLPLA